MKGKMEIIFSRECLNYKVPGHPERPNRVRRAYEYLQEKEFRFIPATPASEEDILQAHSRSLLDKIKTGDFSDPDTPNVPDIFRYACLSAGAAIKAQELSLGKGKKVLSLMRPPGHHATRNILGGFCYFNNIAIAMKKSLERVKRTAILDLDCHHGNGTQDIFLGEERVLFVSLHQSPLYPGTGLRSERNCLNYPLPPFSDEKRYLAALVTGLEKISEFKPEILGISLGFDTYKDDPLGQLLLEEDSYRKIGLTIKELSVPSFAVLEGGYSWSIGPCLYQFILGWA